jgi:hypothetical protein
LNILWVIDFEYSTRLHHGGVMRFVNYAHELQALGHSVYFGVVPEFSYREETLVWLRSQVSEGTISGFMELHYEPPLGYRRTAARVLHPWLSNAALKEFQNETARETAEFLIRYQIDVAILSQRQLLFLAQRLSDRVPWVCDFCDCLTLYDWRDLKNSVRAGQRGAAARAIRRLIPSALTERYYGRRCALSILVSPVDKVVLGRLTGRPDKAAVLLNGTRLPSGTREVLKIPGRLIFSGNMNFIPNSTAAIWFVREVLPKVLAKVPSAHLVIAGANPTNEVLVLAGPHVTVTGYVEDMAQEIASSTVFVAPLISGGGFKNKVIEAIINRTCIVATPVAVEFLDPDLRRSIRVTETPSAMAQSIIEVLLAPQAVQADLNRLYQRVRETFSWEARTRELLRLLEGQITG